jgi:hypothetical protein
MCTWCDFIMSRRSLLARRSKLLSSGWTVGDVPLLLIEHNGCASEEAETPAPLAVDTYWAIEIARPIWVETPLLFRIKGTCGGYLKFFRSGKPTLGSGIVTVS